MIKKTLLTCACFCTMLFLSAQTNPVLEAIGSQSVSDGSVLFFKAAASDADGDELKFSISGSGVKPKMQVDSISGFFIWTPEVSDIGTTNITFKVSDGTNVDSEEITITVTGADSNGDIIYVDIDAAGSNNGTSWANAYTNLGTALTNATDGKQLWVADGTYTADISGGDTGESFIISKELAVYGGFAGGETSRDGRNFQTGKTILSGDLNDDDLTVGNEDNSERICLATASSLLDGVHIIGANGDRGSAFYAARADTWVLIRNTVITKNNSSGNGVSSILTFGTTSGPSAYTIENTLVADNTTTGRLILFESPFTGVNLTQASFINSTFAGNDLLLNGQRAAIVARFVNCVFDANGSNYTFSLGGAAYQFKYCIFPDDPTTHSNTNITLFENNLTNQSIELTPGYSLALGNPAIDAGNNDYVDGTTGTISNDLNGSTRIVDGTVDMGAFEFVPNPSNTAPTLDNPIADQIGLEDQLFAFTFASDVFSDADADELSFGAKLSNGNRLPDWLGFNGSTRTFSGTPAQGETLTIKVTSSDNIANVSDEFDLTISDVNDAPNLTEIGDKVFAAGVEDSFTVTATDEETSSNSLEFSIDNTSESKGMTINSGTGLFSWTPSPDNEGTHTVIFTVSDDADPAATDSETITITVNPNTPPELTEIGSHSVAAGSILFIDAEATDGEGHDITFSLENAPAGMDLFQEQGLLSWIPDASQIGTHDLTVAASDGLDSDSETITITVTESASLITYVNQNASGGNNGSSWEHAYTDLTDALSNVEDGEQIWVASGTYAPGSTGGRTLEFLITNRVVLYGGFSGGESSLNERNVLNNPTILSGDLGNDDDTNGIGENSYHVVGASTTNSASVLDGFVITAGHANGGGSDAGGAAVYSISGSSVLYLKNMVVENNNADQHGVSSIIDFGSSSGPSKLIVSNSVFRNNISTGTVFSINGAVQDWRSTQVEVFNTNISGNEVNVVDAQRASINLRFYNSVIWDHSNSNYLRMLSGATNEFYNCAFDNDPSTMSNSNITVFENNQVDQVIDLSDHHQSSRDGVLRNAGNNSYSERLGINQIDLAGNARINEGTVDIGAVEYENYTPELNTSFDLVMDEINEDEVDNSGTTLSSFIDSNGGIVNDSNYKEVIGMAIVSTDESNGTWEYSTDGGISWTIIGEVSETSALLLPNENTSIRFVPTQDFHGIVEDGLAFKAWDQATGTPEEKIDVSGSEEGAAFSSEQETVSLTVLSVNDIPTIDAGMVSQELTEGAPFEFIVPADAFDDTEDPESLILSAELEDETQLDDVAWLAFNGTSFSGTPDQSAIGTHSIRLTATDSDGGSISLLFEISVSKALALKKDLADQINIFPNAIENKVHLEIDNDFPGDLNLKLMNTQGKLLWEKALQKTKGNNRFNFEMDVPSGIYLLSISTGSTKTVKRLIKK